jgi:glyoxylase-like metal-dependent hydrolase (beta-lactamase superfamily II)
MKAKRVTDNLIQLDRARFVNAYLVREDDGFTLVDTTLSGAAEDIVKAARAAGGEIVRIALTHGHGDHSGSLDALRDLLGAEVPVSLGEADARIHAGEAPKTRGSWPAVATRPDQLLHGGERIGSLEVVANPGHTPGHVAFMDVRDRTLIAGDTYTSTVRVDIPNRIGQPFPLAAMGTEDREQVVEAARALRALEPALLVVGHGQPVRTPLAAMDKAIARVSHGARRAG